MAAKDDKDELIGQMISGRYRIISKLGAGGMGTAYRAWDGQDGVPVVIKIPKKIFLEDPKFAERFRREIRLLQGLTHPHIVPITDVGEHEGLPFVAMRFLPGGSLSNRRLRDEKGKPRPNPAGMLHLWLPAVAEALDFVHSQGVVHRDVKPANIFFDAFWGAYLGDFGIAKIVEESDTFDKEHTLTATHMGIGTQEYMCPEQFTPKAVLDGRADQYALAVMVYEMVAGTRPFTGATAHLIVEVTTQQAPPLQVHRRDLPISLVEAVHRGLSKNPAERFPTCREFAAAVLADVQPLADEPDVTRLLCPKCSNILKLRPEAAGRKGSCPKCNTRMEVADDLGSLWLLDEARRQRKTVGSMDASQAEQDAGVIIEYTEDEAVEAFKPVSSTTPIGKAAGREAKKGALPRRLLAVAAASLLGALICNPGGDLMRALIPDSLREAVGWACVGLFALAFIGSLLAAVLGFLVPTDGGGDTSLPAALWGGVGLATSLFVATLLAAVVIWNLLPKPPLTYKQKLAKAEATLKSDPSNPAANETLGRHWCFKEQDWDKGLPYLSKSNAIGFASAAEKELKAKAASPENSGDLVRAAQGWWQVANLPATQKEEATAAVIKKHAAAIYTAAIYTAAVDGLTDSKDIEDTNRWLERNPEFLKLAGGKRPPKPPVERTATYEEQLAAAESKLTKSPEDQAANEIVGSHWCFRERAWDKGLSYLAKGKTQELVSAAKKEIQARNTSPIDPGEVIKAAKSWWQLAAKPGSLKEEAAEAVRKHAARLYLDNITLLKTPLDLQFVDAWLDADKEFQQLVGNQRPPKRPRTTFAFTKADLEKQFVLHGNTTITEKNEIECRGGQWSKAITKSKFRIPLRVEFDAYAFADRTFDMDPGVLTDETGGGGIELHYGTNVNTQTHLFVFGKRTTGLPHARIEPGRTYRIAFDIDEVRNLTITIDGNVICTETLPEDSRTEGHVSCCGGIGHVAYRGLSVLSPGEAQASGKKDASSENLLALPPLKNSIGIDLKLIPAGTFQMGSDDGEPDEKPVHEIRITKPFYLGVTEVTNAQWKAVMGDVPSKWKDENRPVEQVSWDDAVKFCGKLSALPAEQAMGRVYRLPTEAEWEYACRGGMKTKFSFGDNDANLGDFAWFEGNADKQTHPVGQKRPNPWGLRDMHGNVWEWCSDWYGPFVAETASDPAGPAKGSVRGHRGGGWFITAGGCRSASRFGDKPSFRSFTLGFRLALSPSGTSTLESGTGSKPSSDPGTLLRHGAQAGQTLAFNVVGNVTSGWVWGSNPYTADSRLSKAAVHAGVLRPGEAGVVRVTILPGQQAYEGSAKNGVISSPYGPWNLSYRIEREGGPAAKPDPVVGRWQWFVNGNEFPGHEFLPDGKVKDTPDASWLLVDPKERRYQFLWGNRRFMDIMTLSPDGKALQGRNNEGAVIEGKRMQ